MPKSVAVGLEFLSPLWVLIWCNLAECGEHKASHHQQSTLVTKTDLVQVKAYTHIKL